MGLVGYGFWWFLLAVITVLRGVVQYRFCVGLDVGGFGDGFGWFCA